MFTRVLNAATLDELDRLINEADYAAPEGGSLVQRKLNFLNFLEQEQDFDPDFEYISDQDLVLMNEPNFKKYLGLTNAQLQQKLKQVQGVVGESFADNLINLLQIEKENTHFQELDDLDSPDTKKSTATASSNNDQFVINTLLLYPEEMAMLYAQIDQNYSLRNLCLLVSQIVDRDLEIGDLNTYSGWKKLGFAVKRGEKALGIIAPATPGEQGPRYRWVKRLFVSSQTTAEPVDPVDYFQVLTEAGYSLDNLPDLLEEAAPDRVDEFVEKPPEFRQALYDLLSTVLGQGVYLKSSFELTKQEKKSLATFLNLVLKWIKEL